MNMIAFTFMSLQNSLDQKKMELPSRPVSDLRFPVINKENSRNHSTL